MVVSVHGVGTSRTRLHSFQSVNSYLNSIVNDCSALHCRNCKGVFLLIKFFSKLQIFGLGGFSFLRFGENLCTHYLRLILRQMSHSTHVELDLTLGTSLTTRQRHSTSDNMDNRYIPRISNCIVCQEFNWSCYLITIISVTSRSTTNAESVPTPPTMIIPSIIESIIKKWPLVSNHIYILNHDQHLIIIDFFQLYVQRFNYANWFYDNNYVHDNKDRIGIKII